MADKHLITAKMYKTDTFSISEVQGFIKIMDSVVDAIIDCKEDKEVLSKALELRNEMMFEVFVKTNKAKIERLGRQVNDRF